MRQNTPDALLVRGPPAVTHLVAFGDEVLAARAVDVTYLHGGDPLLSHVAIVLEHLLDRDHAGLSHT